MEDHQHPLVPVVKHFLTKGLLIVGVWGVKHVLWRHTRQKSGKQLHVAAQLPPAPGCFS